MGILRHRTTSTNGRRSSVMGRIVDRTGERFGKLVVLRDVGRKFGGVLWECRCDCGRLIEARASALVCGDLQSCGTYGECYGLWQGGTNNVGSLAWIKKLMNQGKIRAKEEGHAPPAGDPKEIMRAWHSAAGVCEICGKEPQKPQRLVLDHCHANGRFRGFICSQCNIAIGMAADSADRLRKMADYVEYHGFTLSNGYEVRTA
jgi:hypothetical protein